MKIKKANSNNILKNNIVKHVVLEAPTIEELERKLKKYEAILAKALTNLYQVSELNLNRDVFYHVTQNGSYQVAINFHFWGLKRNNIFDPQQTVKDLEQLTVLESGKKHESLPVISSHFSSTKSTNCNEITFEIDSLDKLEDAVCSRQRQIMEDLIKSTYLEEIFFLHPHKKETPETGKINVFMKYHYKTRTLGKKLDEHSNHDEH